MRFSKSVRKFKSSVAVLLCLSISQKSNFVCGGKGRRSYHCGKMIQWLWGDPIIVGLSNQCGKWSNGCGVIQSLCGMIQWLWGNLIIVWNDPMVVGWSNHYGKMIQWFWGDPIIVGNDLMVVGWSNHCGEWSNGCGVIQSLWGMIQCLWGDPIILWGNDPMVVGWSNHCGAFFLKKPLDPEIYVINLIFKANFKKLFFLVIARPFKFS